MKFAWAENNIKLAHCEKMLKEGNLPRTEENIMLEYLRQGGRVIHPKTGELLDNNFGATFEDEVVGDQLFGKAVVERDFEAIKQRVPEFVEAFSKTKKAKKE